MLGQENGAEGVRVTTMDKHRGKRNKQEETNL